MNQEFSFDESVIISKIRAHCLRSCTAEHCNNCALREFGIAHKKIKEGDSYNDN